MEYEIRVRGEGRVQLPAYGLADAEHRVEKELSRLWPGATIRVLDVSRGRDGARIVEEFTVIYRIDGVVNVEVPSPNETLRAAFRRARERLADSRYFHTQWESPTGQ